MTNSKPCKNCSYVVYSDGDGDFWKYDPDTGLFRLVDYNGEFYPRHTHPGARHAQLVSHLGDKLQLSNEMAIVWRSVNMIVDALREGRII